MVRADGLRVPRSASNAANHYRREMSVSVGGAAPSAMEFFMDNDEYPSNGTEDAGGQHDWV